MTEPPQLEGLARFARSRERHLTEFFVGREAEMAAMRNAVAVVAERYREGHMTPGEDGAVLITGVPGAGKTSLMSHLRKEWSEPKGDGPVGVAAGLEDLTTQEALAAAVHRTVSPGLRERVTARLSSVSIGALGTGATVDLAQLSEDIGKTDRPIVLFIDEIQDVPEDRTRPEMRLLKALHLGTHGAPIQPVLAGLAHAEDRLSKVGMSRISPVLALAGLSPDEVQQSVTLFLDRFRVAGDRAGWPERLAHWSEGWPMHLHNALRALAAELAANGGDLNRVDRLAVRRRATRARLRYYNNRTTELLGRNRTLLALVMDDIDPRFGTADDEIIDSLVRHGGGRPGGLSPEDAFQAMLAKGLIQAGSLGDHVCPIPSLQSWCAVRTGNRLHRLAMVGDSVAVRQRLGAGDDTRAKDTRGRTPLHIAAEENWPQIAELLIKAGADPDARDGDGRRPADVARRGSETWQVLTGPPEPRRARRQVSLPEGADGPPHQAE